MSDPVSETFIQIAALVAASYNCGFEINWERNNFNILSDSEEMAIKCAQSIEDFSRVIFCPKRVPLFPPISNS